MERGQAHTLESLLAAIVLVISLVFALQVSAVTPMTESTSSQHVENQQEAVGQDILEAAAEDGTLKSAVLYWNVTNDSNTTTYHSASKDGVYYQSMPTALGSQLEQTLRDRGIAYTLRVNYISDNETKSRTIVSQGQPSDQAIVVTHLLTLYETDHFYNESEQRSEENLTSADDFYIPNEGSDAVYNVIEVELITWRM